MDRRTAARTRCLRHGWLHSIPDSLTRENVKPMICEVWDGTLCSHTLQCRSRPFLPHLLRMVPASDVSNCAENTGWPDYLTGTAKVPLKEVFEHKADTRTVTLFNKDLGVGYLELEERQLPLRTRRWCNGLELV